MRIYVIPILKNHWAYYCHSNIPSISRLDRAVAWAGEKWSNLGKAPSDSWKAKAYRTGENLMDRMEYEEWFLKGVKSKEDVQGKVTRIMIQHPSTITPDRITSHLEHFLSHRVPYHHKYMRYSAAWVPLACTFAIVPLIPNFPLAYNLFRLYSHYKAYKGAEHLQDLQMRERIDLTVDQTLDLLLSDTSLHKKRDLIFPSEILSPVDANASSVSKRPMVNLNPLHERHIEGTISNDTIKRIAKHLGIPALEKEIMRARYQVLARIVNTRADDIEKGVHPTPQIKQAGEKEKVEDAIEEERTLHEEREKDVKGHI